MSVKERVLAVLDGHAGVHVSGEEIAARLDVTRSAVWKAIKALQAEGYPIEGITNKGYSLSPDADILSARSISDQLNGSCAGLRVERFKTLPSTNLTAKELAANGEAEGKVIVAEGQTAGRGRQGRPFYSPHGTGLYMSLLLRPDLSASDSALLTTAAAVAVCKAIEHLSGEETQIKWVNDVYMRGKKICGILTEASVSLESGLLEYAVLGVGINVARPLEGFPEELAGTASSIFPDGASPGGFRNRLAAEILNRFMAEYSRLTDRAFLPHYRERLFLLGRQVTVLQGNAAPRSAVALDINDDCHLKVQYDDGTVDVLPSGEIRVTL